MNIYDDIRQILSNVLENAVKDGDIQGGLTYDHITMEPPKDPSHGDMATNAALVLAKQASTNPRALAELLAPRLESCEQIVSVDIAGPGFINLRLQPALWCDILKHILKVGIDFGASDMGKDQSVNVEYVSANPTGPMHIGHARGAVYGDALCSLLKKVGYNVTREYYINDGGAQIDVLLRSVLLRYRQALGQDIGAIPEGLYPGDYLVPVGDALAKEYKDRLLAKDESEVMPMIRSFVLDSMMDMIRSDLKDLGVEHDVFTSEQAIVDAGVIRQAFDLLESKHLLYRGILEPPKGKKPDDWEPREQLLFKASEFGDDVDRPLQKSDGSNTYFAVDIAYHLDKIERGFERLVLVLGADHGGYVKRIKAIVAALSDQNVSMDVKISQLVNFLDKGQPIKMSKRKGSFTTVKDVVDEVGKDVVRFIMLTRKNDAVLDFDLEGVKEQSKDNPVFYVQYAHARASSVLGHAARDVAESMAMTSDISVQLLEQLNDEDERALIRLLAGWPRVIEQAARANEPHRIAFYLQEVAAGFHMLWNKGKDHAILRFILPDDVPMTGARLVLVKATMTVIASGLLLLNVTPKDEM